MSLKLFLAGLPGTGKSEFGNFLAQKKGFVHFDLEKPIWPQPKLRPIWEKLFKLGQRNIGWWFCTNLVYRQRRMCKKMVSKKGK